MISIILPYLTTNKCIDLFEYLIKQNTVNPYEILTVADNKDVYGSFNHMAAHANGDVLIFMNDDIFVTPRWDVLYKKYAKGKTIVTGYLVEPGVAPVSEKNIEKDFGRNPFTFDHKAFQKWAATTEEHLPEVEDGKGWYLPMAVEKRYFIDFPNEQKFPYPNDILLVDNILPNLGYNFKKVRSIAYHLQGYSHIKQNRDV